jgi:hypothetical protein
MKKIFFLTALAVMVLASCGKDNDAGSPSNSLEGDDATLSIKMTFPLTTYADDTATPEESAVSRIDVFVFDYVSGNLIKYERMNVSDFTINNNVYTAKKGIVTVAGQRQIGVGINLPDATVLAIRNEGNISAVNNQTVYDVTTAMIATANKFVMFNVDMPPVTVVPDITAQTGDNMFSMNIERLTGKAALAKTADFAPTADVKALGEFLHSTRVEYRLMQTNKKSYLMRDPAGKDPNFRATDFIVDGSTPVGNQYDASVFENTTASAYKDVESMTAYTDQSERPAFYGAENTADVYEKGATTYFLVRARFKPNKFSNAQGQPETVTYNEGQDFWVVTDGSKTHICISTTTANALAANATVFPDAGAVTVTQHEGAYCYWPVWVRYNGAYEFLRNSYYVGRINSISGFGSGNELAVIVPPDEPVNEEEKATIQCDFTILPWTYKLGAESALQ